jgi:peptidoglycan-N-acetylglucosamine deacetylase
LDRQRSDTRSCERMKPFRFVWPEGKPGALTTSWDDGTIHDRRLVPILNQYGIKGTWNLSSSLLGMDKTQTGFMDMIAAKEVLQLYAGHEVACHSATHPGLASMPENVILSELIHDRQGLEVIMGAPVQGLAYPFGSTNVVVRTIARSCGLVYGRGASESRTFLHPDDFMDWPPSFHFDEHYRATWEDFINPLWDGKLLYIFGHSFEFEPDKWDQIEDFCRMAGNHPEIWYATNMEVYEYITAWRGLNCTVDLSFIKNNSSRQVWVRCEGKLVCINPGEICSV